MNADIGLSIDQLQSHMKWTEFISKITGKEIDSQLSRRTGRVANTLGMVHPGKAQILFGCLYRRSKAFCAMMYYPQELAVQFTK